MTAVEQLDAVALALAARKLLRDSLASDREREQLAAQIDRFIEHRPIDHAAIRHHLPIAATMVADPGRERWQRQPLRGDIVQITDSAHPWFPALLVVERVGAWGVQAVCYSPISNSGEAATVEVPIRLPAGSFQIVGVALAPIDPVLVGTT